MLYKCSFFRTILFSKKNVSVHSVQILMKSVVWIIQFCSYPYHETFEIDERLGYADIVRVHKQGQLRNIVTFKLKYFTYY